MQYHDCYGKPNFYQLFNTQTKQSSFGITLFRFFMLIVLYICFRYVCIPFANLMSSMLEKCASAAEKTLYRVVCCEIKVFGKINVNA